MRRKVGVYVKSRGAALIRGAATNTEFTVLLLRIISYLFECTYFVKHNDTFLLYGC